jgi:hypothetical protein
MILLHQAYRSPDPRRQEELEAVRRNNETAGLFDDIVVVDGSAVRLSFGDLFRLAADRFAGRTCVIANSDIAFDASIRNAEPLVCRDEPTLVALTRWEDAGGPSMEGRVDQATWRFYAHSQDAWVFVAGGLPAFGADFRLGIPGCENRLAYEAAAAGVAIVDPALSIKTLHVHASAIRSWHRGDAYRGPLLFPRMTTVEAASADALVLERTWWRTREIAIPRTGDRAAFAAARLGGGWPRIGLRSPFYVRKR